jgi:hypothetical protein
MEDAGPAPNRLVLVLMYVKFLDPLTFAYERRIYSTLTVFVSQGSGRFLVTTKGLC